MIYFFLMILTLCKKHCIWEALSLRGHGYPDGAGGLCKRPCSPDRGRGRSLVDIDINLSQAKNLWLVLKLASGLC